MSKVYSFRLDADNPREAQAREVIDVWVSQGYSLRHILTDALIRYGCNGDTMKEWDKIYDQITELVREFGNGMVKKESVRDNSDLSPQFVFAVKNSVKTGLTSR
ncbi:hypothetical protein ACFLV7_12300 [Chloroflexota bacterium]